MVGIATMLQDRHDPALPSVFHVVGQHGWQDYYQRSASALKGVANVYEVVVQYVSALEQLVEDTKPPALFINHAFCVDASEWVDLCKRHPIHRFVAVNHCSPNHAVRWVSTFAKSAEVLDACRLLDNLYYATTDRHVNWAELGYPKGRILHNPIRLVDPPEISDVNPPLVAIVGRDDWEKGFASQIIAMKIISKYRPDVRFAEIVGFKPPNWYGFTLLKTLSLPFESIPWGDTDQWYENLRTGISVVMQCSLAESFNLVSIDAAMYFRPFIGSFSISHTPELWRANPSDPSDIARRTLYILENYQENQKLARELAETVAEEQNDLYRGVIQELLHG